MRQPWIVTFDVGADQGRYGVHRALAPHGIRTMYTVYELLADAATVGALTERLRPHVGDHDHLLALPTCSRCRTAGHGTTIEQLPAHTWIAT